MKRDTFLPSITTLLIFGMSVFLSCAHQNRVRDGLNEEASAEEEQSFVSEEGSATPEGEQPSGELSELTPTPEEATTPAPTDELAAATTTTEDADLKALGLESTDATAPADTAGLEATTETQAIGDATAGALPTDPAATTAAAPTEAGLDPLAGIEAGATASAPLDATASTDPALTAPPTETTTATNNVEITHMEPIMDSSSGSKSSYGSSGGGWSGTSSVPKIPSKAKNRKGALLNRFYMSRAGDTPASTSRLFYGSEDRASDVANWNGKKWQPGTVLYYQSAVEPTDTSMRSFYQEKGVQPEEYTIAKGDWLSKVARKQLGHPRSWKEIAVVNGMNSPDSIEVGQKIAIYPKDLSGYSQPQPPPVEEPKEEPQPVAQAPEMAPPPQQQQPVQPPQNQPVDPNAELARQLPPPEPPPVQEPQRPQPQAQALDSGKLIEQNLPAIFILGGVLVLSGLYLVVRRKKSSKPLDDFGDENFAPPTKLKRK